MQITFASKAQRMVLPQQKLPLTDYSSRDRANLRTPTPATSLATQATIALGYQVIENSGEIVARAASLSTTQERLPFSQHTAQVC